jgi:hypothetical protein
MQIVGQAVTGTGSLDDAELAKFTRDASFKTVIGDVKFGKKGGGWSVARVLQVQYQNIKSANLSEFKDAGRKPSSGRRALPPARSFIPTPARSKLSRRRDVRNIAICSTG